MCPSKIKIIWIGHTAKLSTQALSSLIFYMTHPSFGILHVLIDILKVSGMCYRVISVHAAIFNFQLKYVNLRVSCNKPKDRLRSVTSSFFQLYPQS